MKEIRDILLAFDRHQQSGKKMAMATVVHVEGSSYRQPGARMLVTEDGELTGAISGGCLEGDALRKARLAMAQNQNLLVTYDTTDDDDAKLGVGLGCNGIIHILIEPINTENPNHPIQLLKEAQRQRHKAVVVTLFNWQDRKAEQPGSCLLLTQHGQPYSTSLDKTLEEAVLADAREALEIGHSQIKSYSEAAPLTGFVQVLKPTVSLVICGAGNDVMPLVNMAALLGWETTVVDGRANYATAERFPMANRVLVAKPPQVLPQVMVDDHTVFLLLTHNYNYDLAILRQVLPLPLPYVGVLGPKKKLTRMLEELQDEGIEMTEEMLQKVFGPTGLDIGAEASEEISLSILAEIKAVLSQRAGTFLRDKQEPIHTRGINLNLASFSSI
ncbi:XdhC family protein [Rufibacter roseus]|uniref:XdhC family protein n=1 Tax=Rufibacter roseus TaxID=1567108 RepID=A0ABW2DMF9_9BACT|nr:XdhC/CoxI family protein [Rufibacter roseus]